MRDMRREVRQSPRTAFSVLPSMPAAGSGCARPAEACEGCGSGDDLGGHDRANMETHPMAPLAYGVAQIMHDVGTLRSPRANARVIGE
jgi:hypothetical protein